MREETIRIPYPASDEGRKAWNREYGLNAIYAGKHWARRKNDAQYWHTLVQAAVNRDCSSNRIFDKPVTITFFWNDALDLSNHAYMAKMIEDALKGRLIQDDNRKWVKGWDHRWHDGQSIVVTLKEIGG